MRKTRRPAVSVQYLPVATLKANDKNPRVIKDAAFESLCRSLKEDPEYFAARPLLANRDRVVFAGNQRLKAAIEIGLKEVPVIVMDNPELEAKRMLRDNISSGTWDYGALDDSFDIDFLREVGFNEDELATIGQSNIGDLNDDVDLIPPTPLKAETKPGDLWIFGDRHRLLCGDSANPADVDRLLGGAKIQLVNSDPPYNVAVASRSGSGIAAAGRRGAGGRILRPKDRPIANDSLSEADYEKTLLAWFDNFSRVLEPGRAFYIWGGYANLGNYPPALKTSGLRFAQLLVWVKNHPVMNRKDFLSDFELCYYGWREGGPHRYWGPNNVTDVWQVRKVSSQNMIHLTQKPVELATRAITYSTIKGENVLDLFAGSGSTLIACERTERRAFLCEIDPLYVDVMRKRYEILTGKKAVLHREKPR